MVEIINAIGTGIVNRLVGSVNPFKAAISDKLFYMEAPQNVPGTAQNLKPPYCVYSVIPSQPTRDSANKFYDATVQFNIYSLYQTDEALTIAGYLIELLEDSESALVIPGFKLIRIDQGAIVQLGKVDDVYGVVVPYKLHLQN